MSVERSGEPPQRSSAGQVAFEQAARRVRELARDPRCPRLTDDVWNALLRGQVARDDRELGHYAETLREFVRRLGQSLLL